MREVFNFFKKHYEKASWNRPTLEGMMFNIVEEVDCRKLEEEFSVEESWSQIKKRNNTFVALIPKILKPVTIVAKVINPSQRSGTVLSNGLQVFIGGGFNTRLWQDVVVDSVPLKIVFPRIYALASNKKGYILEYGYWQHMTWACSFHRRLEEIDNDSTTGFRLPWKGKCPPKVEFFVWQLAKGKVHVAEVPYRRNKWKKVEAWIPPMYSYIKFIIDGSDLGKPGSADISGVLRDGEGKVLCMFSLFLGAKDSNAMETLAIHKAVDLCSSVSACEGRNLVIESDLKIVVLGLIVKEFEMLIICS
ncbi:hypothetical protein Ddye_001715 [Dipteronia dyeriana]|uniref:RNase H type-1 domain-containing protein n=1 Tax=Dipteronia dyeriana TaxID=168575 RepID=A0AAD9XPL1_9ROSI|nr:hypothetical protein Ddye_001715 [Dipteronia dyeriana]